MVAQIRQMVSEDSELTPAQIKRAEYYQSPEGLAKLAAENKKTANIQALTQQILGQKTTDKWTGQGYGSAEKNAEAMAKMLDAAGMTDIKQFGKVDKYEPVQEIGKTYNGKQVYSTGPDEYGNGGGDYYYREATDTYDSDGNQQVISVRVPKDAKLDTLYGFLDGNGEGYNPIDSSKVVMRDGVPTTVTGKTWGNKETGQTIESGSGRWQWQGGDNLFGGTGEGKGNTAYRVQLLADGTPIFYTTQGSSNDFAKLMSDLGPVGQIGLAIATGGLSIPEQIAAKFAMNVLSGQDIGDAVKGAAASYAISQIPGTNVLKDASKFLNGIDDTGVLSSAFKNATMSGAGALLTGQDVSKAMLAGATTGGVNGALNALMDTSDFKDLTKDLSASQKKMVINAATGVMSGKPIDQIIINSAMSAAKDAALKAQTENQVLDPYFKSMGSKVAGADDSITLPSGIQLAGTTNDIFSDAGNGVFKMEGGGPPLFAESKGADALKLPFGTRLMSSNEEVEEVDPDTGRTVYKKPENAYYDPTLNAWLVKEDASQMFNASSFLNDMALFNSSQGDLKDVASKTESTNDDYLADFLKSMGITSTDDLYVRELSPQDILDLIGYTGDGVDTVKVTDKRLTDAAEDLTVANKNLTNNTNVVDAGTLNVTDKKVVDAGTIDVTDKKVVDAGTIDVTDKRITPVGGTEELVMTAKRPVLDEVTTDIDRIKANEITLDDLTSDADTKVDKKVTPKTTPATVTIPTTTADTPYVPTGQAPPPSQDPYAKVKFMEDIFGPELSNQFLTDVSMQTPKTNDLEALLRLLRG